VSFLQSAIGLLAVGVDCDNPWNGMALPQPLTFSDF